MCCLSLEEEGKHINKILRKSQESARTVPGQSWARIILDNPMKVFFMHLLVYCFFALKSTGVRICFECIQYIARSEKSQIETSPSLSNVLCRFSKKLMRTCSIQLADR